MLTAREKFKTPIPMKFSFSEVKEQSEVIWRDQVCGTAARFTLLCLGLGLVFWLWQYHNLPPQVPLFYSRPWGEVQLVPPLALAILPGGTIIILMINSFLGGLVFSIDKLMARILLIAAAMGGFLATLALVKIVWLVV